MYVNIGQTRFALVRDGLPLLVRGTLGREGRIVLSLHGSFFMDWQPQSLRAHLLRRMARVASAVTVLGKAQRRSLARLGIAEHKIVLMDNTCLVTPLADEECERKQAAEDAIRVLFLSNLMEGKGYPEFLEAIGLLAATCEKPLHAILCGSMLDTGPGERFASTRTAAEWVRGRCEEINASRSVRIEWLPGLQGREKEALLRDAHILAFPSKREAQPIVLLEALASGCALITTNVGMIPETVDAETAILLDPGDAKQLAEAIALLAREPGLRAQLARRGLQLFRRRFSYQEHLDRWESLLE